MSVLCRSVGRLVIWLASKAFVVVWYVLKLIQKLKYQIKYKWIRYCFHIICSCFGAVLLLGMSIENSWDFSSTTTRIKSTNRQVVPPKNRVEGYRKHKITKYNAGCNAEYYGTSVESQRYAILIRKVVGARWGPLITQLNETTHNEMITYSLSLRWQRVEFCMQLSWDILFIDNFLHHSGFTEFLQKVPEGTMWIVPVFTH